MRNESGHLRQREVEGGSLFHFRVRPDAATVPVNDALDDRKSDTSAGELIFAMEALEDAEKLFRELHVKSRTVVLDQDMPLVSRIFRGNPDDGAFPLPGEFQRI